MAEEFKYYVTKAFDGLLELRQTRFMGENHPHDVCAVARDKAQMADMLKLLKGTTDWSRVGGKS